MDASLSNAIKNVVRTTKTHRDAFAIPELIKILEKYLQETPDNEGAKADATLNFVDAAAKALAASPIYSDTLIREFYRSAIDAAEAGGVASPLILEDLLFQSLKRSTEGETSKR